MEVDRVKSLRESEQRGERERLPYHSIIIYRQFFLSLSEKEKQMQRFK